MVMSVSSTWTRYVKADVAFGVRENKLIANSSGFSSETGLMNVLFGPIDSRFEKLSIRIVSCARFC